MKATSLLILALSALSARADFSYATATKSGGPAAGQTTRYFLKGQKLMIDVGDNSVLTDFDAQTITTLSKTKKTYSVSKFSDMAKAMPSVGDIHVDIKETGQKRVINGFNSTQVIMNMGLDMSQQRPGMKMQMEMEIWVSPEVPGAPELRTFYQRNAEKFPWGALMNGDASFGNAMADMQRKLAGLNGVPVLQIIRMKPGGTDAQAAQMQQQMAQARTRLEEMAKQGGQQAEMAKKALAQMGPPAGGGALLELTVESRDFSTSSIPASTFAIPEGYREEQKKQ